MTPTEQRAMIEEGVKVDGLTLKVLTFFGEVVDDHDSLWWRVYDDRVVWLVNCNDLFAWGCSDCEEITEENFPMLEQAFKDCCEAIGKHSFNYSDLWIARVRKMRPQGAAYPDDEKLWPLFDACGPERPTGMGNPYRNRREYMEARKK